MATKQRNGSAPVAEELEAHAAQSGGAGPSTQKHETLAEALVAAQIEMPAVEPDKTNPHFKSSYVSLGHLLAKARPVLNRHGIAVVQAPMVDDEGRFVLRTTLMHSAGDSLAFDSPLTPTKNDPQAQGSAITYMRRYALSAAVAIADQDDDDGNAGSAQAQTAPSATARDRKPSERPITGAQKGKINALMAEAGLEPEEASAVRLWWCSVAQCSQYDRLPSASASGLIERLGEDGSGARVILDELKIAANDGNEMAVKIIARMQEAHGA